MWGRRKRIVEKKAESPDIWDVQPGPCKMCGVKNYPLSRRATSPRWYGGPDVCPACDTGIISDKSGGNLIYGGGGGYMVSSSMSIISFVSSVSFVSSGYGIFAPSAATIPPSDEYKEFLRWKKNREEEAKQEEPPPLERPLRLIELEDKKSGR